MVYKLNKAKFRNFCKFEDFECHFHDEVTRLVGLNGSGKSTIGLRGIIACIHGIAEKGVGLIGKRYLFIGKSSRSADIEYEFLDKDTNDKFVVRNHLTDASNKIELESEGKAPLSIDWLKRFLGSALMSAKAFSALSGIEQARLVGVDTSEFDTQIEKLKKEASDIRSKIDFMGNLKPVEEVKPVDVDEIEVRRGYAMKAYNDGYKANRDENARRREEHAHEVDKASRAVEEFQKAQSLREAAIVNATNCLTLLEKLGYIGDEVGDFIRELPKPEEKKIEEIYPLTPLELIDPELPDDTNIKAIEAEKQAAIQNNFMVAGYQEYLKAKEKLECLKKELEDNIQNKKNIVCKRAEYISTRSFGFKGLSADEKGFLTLEGRPINESYWSKGELEIIVATIAASLNPDVKVRFVDDFDCIDSTNQEKILKRLLEMDFQVIVAEVGDKSDKPNTILLKECKITSDDQEQQSIL